MSAGPRAGSEPEPPTRKAIEIRADTVKQAVRDEPDRIRWIAA
ncbi:hypothetical protein [Methylobacterium fujisawaense]|nr:hypothetical protein [Methylobacterium fujisawaense]MDH3032621.1 hypothetical protein [Methylobacterium fujisawaense]